MRMRMRRFPPRPSASASSPPARSRPSRSGGATSFDHVPGPGAVALPPGRQLMCALTRGYVHVRRGGRGPVAALLAALSVVSLWGCRAGAHTEPEPPLVAAGPAYQGRTHPERVASDGVTVVVGDPQAPLTVHVYLDPRCPVCREFEDNGGRELTPLVSNRLVKVEYTMASFLDDSQGGTGSKKAVNALRAAVDAGRFAEYLTVLYQEQPEEGEDGFTDEFLIDKAYYVPDLVTPEFQDAVKTMKYADFVDRSEHAFEESGVPGTPVLEINGTRLEKNFADVPFNRPKFQQLLQKIIQRPQRWR
ncbi:thioredoxin domain-containing protein [Streptomyces goshikiensis]|uniref:thioredoxin domain-containing protein n=1 Tax=Streptomyces goshikiensis TaxID=1942 RepID=UPI0036C58713